MWSVRAGVTMSQFASCSPGPNHYSSFYTLLLLAGLKFSSFPSWCPGFTPGIHLYRLMPSAFPPSICASNTPEGPAFRGRLWLGDSDVGPQSAAGPLETQLTKVS